MILTYRILTNLLYPFLIIFLLFRILLKKEDPKRYKEKIFIKNFNIEKKNNHKLIWFHAASIGELKSIMPIISEINKKKNNLEFLVTTNTLSSARLAEEEFKKLNNITHRFMPLDINFLIENFLNSWKPDKIFLVDSEIWPNLILKAKQKKIPIALINARLTKKSFKRWSKFPGSARKLFGIFDLCLCGNSDTKNFLHKFNAKNVKYEGNLKLINQINIEELNKETLKILSNSKFWVAASIHDGEDLFCLKTHIELKKEYQNIISIIAPRHLDRVLKIKKLSENLNLKTQILESNEKINKNSEIILINSFGDLQNYYFYSKSVFIGKSIIKKLKKDSGQNPIDAAYLNCKIYHGPYVSNFYEIYNILEKNKISKKVENYSELSKYLISDLREQKKIQKDYSNYVHILGKNVLTNTMSILENFLNLNNENK